MRDVSRQWKRLCSRQWRWGYQADNFTSNLRDYYGYNHVVVSDAALVIEGGEITCPPQAEWVREHLNWEAGAIAYLLSQRRTFLADEQGLGKTIEAIATLEADGAYPAIVICPASLKLNLMRELERWLPHRSARITEAVES